MIIPSKNHLRTKEEIVKAIQDLYVKVDGIESDLDDFNSDLEEIIGAGATS